jgi:hypothetical protein
VGAAIAIVSVVSSAVVAVVVALLASRGETARLELQISAERLDELRGVLDEAASALSGALLAMNSIVSRLDFPDQRGGDPRTVDELYSEFEDQYWAAARQRERIALRLGPHAELVETYGTAIDAFHALFAAWEDRRSDILWDGPPSASANRAAADAGSAYSALLELAAAMVGPSVGKLRG